MLFPRRKAESLLLLLEDDRRVEAKELIKVQIAAEILVEQVKLLAHVRVEHRARHLQTKLA